MKFLAEQPGRFFLDDLTDPPGVIRVGSACVIRPFGSGFVVAGGDGRLDVLAVSSTLEGAVAAALVEPECVRGDDPDREAALADGLRALRRAIDRTKETLSAAGNDRAPNDAAYEVLRSAVDDLAALRDDAAEQQATLRADAGARIATLETRTREFSKKSTVELQPPDCNQPIGHVHAQKLAVAVWDRGCLRCDEPHYLTDLHHLLDWTDGGPTDIDNLASLCGPPSGTAGTPRCNWPKRATSGKPAPAPDHPPAQAPPPKLLLFAPEHQSHPPLRRWSSTSATLTATHIVQRDCRLASLHNPNTERKVKPK